ncbi:MAG TPA: LysR family transcriptional regulator [Stellaceae bacterium]|nr:LysR family transcriptional regulator [Stellaceae bacterium]
MDDAVSRSPISVASRVLEYFIAIAELGSVSRAAMRLGITQPALSRQIKRLEEQLGVPMLERHWRGVRLTPAGERLYQEASSLQRQFQQLCAELADGGGSPSGSVTIAVTPSAGDLLVPELIARYRALYPLVRVVIRQGYSEAVEQMLEEGHADFALFPTYPGARPPSANLLTQPLVRERELLAGPGDPPLQARYTFVELVELPLIVPARGNGLRQLLETVAADRRLTLAPIAEIDGMTLIKALVRRGLGCTILPLHAMQPEMGAGYLQAAEIVEPALERVYVTAWHATRALPRAAGAIAPLVPIVVNEMVATGAWPNAEMLAPQR